MEIDAEPQPQKSTALPAAIMLGLISILGGLLTLREPLWIDELHTYWACSGSLSSVASRAQFGNQSPLWFWLDAFCLQSASSLNSSPAIQQIALRLPSLLCWFATFFIIGLRLPRCVGLQLSSRTEVWTLMCSLGALLWCDQLSWFYAIEARPYAMVCLLCTISALAQYRMFWGSDRLQRFIYIASSVAAIYIHYTSIVVLACIWLGGMWLNSHARKSHFLDLLVVLIFSIPAFGHLLQIGQARQLWNSFAGNADWASVRSLLPIDWLAIAAIFWYVQRSRGKNRFDQATALAFRLALSICLSVLAVWIMGAAGIAPLVHSRYVLGAYPLVVLAAGILLAQLNSKIMMFMACSLMALAWMIVQGGPFVVRYSAPIVWQRHENWPAAIEAIQQSLSVAKDVQLVFAPMLVETANQQSIDRYGRDQLAYGWIAAKSLYGDPSTESRLVEPLLLSNAVDRWGEELKLSAASVQDYLILARTDATSLGPWLQRHLAAIENPQFKLECLFGNSVQRLSVFRIRKNP